MLVAQLEACMLVLLLDHVPALLSNLTAVEARFFLRAWPVLSGALARRDLVLRVLSDAHGDSIALCTASTGTPADSRLTAEIVCAEMRVDVGMLVTALLKAIKAALAVACPWLPSAEIARVQVNNSSRGSLCYGNFAQYTLPPIPTT